MITQKEIFIIAGPNGSGKTTFAMDLIDQGLIEHYLNADEIAKELTIENSAHANARAARCFLKRLKKASLSGESFALETTLSGLGYLDHIKKWQESGWKVSIFYLFLSSVDVSKQRVAERVTHGGHSIPIEDIERRFPKGIKNFYHKYAKLADYAQCIYNENQTPVAVFSIIGGRVEIHDAHLFETFSEVAND
ncbi:AAA family ATPase [Maribrevibacterium harenarium]|nr:AAA family ATPase [Maribrevibacterium harenarium]